MPCQSAQRQEDALQSSGCGGMVQQQLATRSLPQVNPAYSTPKKPLRFFVRQSMEQRGLHQGMRRRCRAWSECTVVEDGVENRFQTHIAWRQIHVPWFCSATSCRHIYLTRWYCEAIREQGSAESQIGSRSPTRQLPAGVSGTYHMRGGWPALRRSRGGAGHRYAWRAQAQ